MIARIYSPAKTAMQSGNAKTGSWVLEFEREKPRKIEPLMGYTSSSDMNAQIRLEFPTLEAAKAFAEKEGIAYRVQAKRVDSLDVLPREFAGRVDMFGVRRDDLVRHPLDLIEDRTFLVAPGPGTLQLVVHVHQ